MDINDILIRPVITESTFDLIEMENKIVFIVHKKANKNLIKYAVENLYNVKCVKVNTMITPLGEKKAFVRLSPNDSASEVANKIGLF
ncbi:MAG: 50S ribosomal protein L23 [Candidatus Hodarchaeota archaeon]